MRLARGLAVFAAAAIVGGAALLRFGFVDGAEENWTPVRLPVPAAGNNVSEAFHLTSGGRFTFQVVTTATEAEQAALNREGPPIDTFVTLQIRGPHGFRIARSITHMALTAWAGGI